MENIFENKKNINANLILNIRKIDPKRTNTACVASKYLTHGILICSPYNQSPSNKIHKYEIDNTKKKDNNIYVITFLLLNVLSFFSK